KAIALSHFGLGKQAAGETQFESLVKEFPRNIWGYIAWGDMYYQPLHKSIKRNFEKAEDLYQTALKKEKKDSTDKKNIMEKSVATERLDELHREKMKIQ
ncbi:MAG: hypothetical protein JXJ04_26510, partial [Spirochaetales bacterium]|nr:hypothetical protein [Spirochaetales bacterium]